MLDVLTAENQQLRSNGDLRIGLTGNERKFIVDKISNKNINKNIKDKFLKMKELLTKMGVVKTDNFYQYPCAFCLCYNKQVYNYKQEAWR